MPDEIVVFGSASEAFSQKNINCSIAESIERFAPVVEAAGCRHCGARAMSCTVGCPYEGEIAPERGVAYLAGLLKGIGVQRGRGRHHWRGHAAQVQRPSRPRCSTTPSTRCRATFTIPTAGRCPTRAGRAGAGGVELPVLRGGLGGCPYAKGATGNVATEDVVLLLHGMGIETGIDLDKLIDAGAYISDFLGRKPNSRAATALLNKRGVEGGRRHRCRCPARFPAPAIRRCDGSVAAVRLLAWYMALSALRTSSVRVRRPADCVRYRCSNPPSRPCPGNGSAPGWRRPAVRPWLPIAHRAGGRQREDEFVSAQPRHQVVGPDLGLQSLGHRAQHHVARVMPVCIVDGLEPVQVKQHDRDGRAIGQHRAAPWARPVRLASPVRGSVAAAVARCSACRRSLVWVLRMRPMRVLSASAKTTISTATPIWQTVGQEEGASTIFQLTSTTPSAERNKAAWPPGTNGQARSPAA